MSGTSQCISTSINQSTTIQSQSTNPFTAIKAINRSELTKGAKILYSQLRISAGPKGYVFYRVFRLAEDTKSSISSTKEYLHELKSVGLVIPEYRPGHSNKWCVFDPAPAWDGKVPGPGATPPQPDDQWGGSRDTDGGVAGPPATLKNVVQDVRTKNVNNVIVSPQPQDPIEREPVPTTENDNVQDVSFTDHFEPKDSSPVPQTNLSTSVNTDRPTPLHPSKRPSNPIAHTPNPPRTRKVFNAHLLTEILDLTGDSESKGCWISVINRVPEERIRYALSCLRMTINDGTILDRPGAYLLTIIMANNPDLTFKRAKYRSSHPQAQSSNHPETYQPPTPDVPSQPPQPTTRRFREPQPDIPEPLNIEALIKGWKLMYEPGDVSHVLRLVQLSLPEWNALTTWEALRLERPEDTEISVLNNFLDLAAFKVQWESMAEGNAST